MSHIHHRLGSLVLGALLGLSAWPAAADDTELFVATSDPSVTGALPNILFILDNSGSMSSEVVTQEDWDAGTSFDGCYQADRIYWSTTGSIPTCGTDNYFDKSKNYCYASYGPLKASGSYYDKFRGWRSSSSDWRDLSTSSHSRPTECEGDVDDDGNPHGKDKGDGEPYPVNGANGPWHSSGSITWATNYTIYDGNWLNWYTSDGTVTKTRMEVVRTVTNNLLETLQNVNVGLMHFNDNQGGTVSKAIANITTSRSAMQSAVSALNAETWTPLSETLYEAANYYMGRDVDYGNTGPVKSVAASRVGNIITGTKYQMPTTVACQKNYIVLLTDGLPTQDTGATTKIKALDDWAANVTNASCSGAAGSNGQCMSDLAEYLYRHDFNPSMAGVQNVTTYTIGFGVDLALGDTTFLEQTATKGGGKYYPALDTATLTEALTKIFFDILDDSQTFSTPTAPVNAFNRTQNLNDVYVSVFTPAANKHWPGNLKKYRLQGGQLVDANGNAAVDASTGFFAETSQSYWSDAVDGPRASAGGAANELPVHTDRNLYTDVSGGDLNASNNLVKNTNAAVITAARVGAPNDDTRDKVVDWARGLDLFDEDDDGADDDVRHVMGDPLHVRPVMVNYGDDEDNLDATVYVSTNDGYLHAVDPDDGSELWAYVPEELLDRLYELYLNEASVSRTYGLDGEISVYIENDDGNPGITGEEKVILLFGMRRGGDTLYALDVTDRSNPQLRWKISSATAGYEDLGQTWSPPVVAPIRLDGGEKWVAIFGGGYDDTQDGEGYFTDTRGNAVFMADMADGSIVWSAGNGADHDLDLSNADDKLAMTHSIPAGIRVLDIDQDSLADRMYVGDMGGRVWRFDIRNADNTGASNLVTGGVLAYLGVTDPDNPLVPDVRRFYATPDVARIVSGTKMYLAVNLGSGHREHPLDTETDDEFYALRDYNVFDLLDNDDVAYTDPIVRSDLVDITYTITPTIPYNSPGWRMGLVLDAGEKVVSESRTFYNSVIFTSFTPGGNGASCVAAGGKNRLYVISVRDGSPLANLDGSEDDTLSLEDRSRDLNQGGLAPDPAMFFSPPDDQPDPDVECVGPGCQDGDGDGDGDDDGTEETLCIGVECFDPGFPNPPRRTHWNQTGTE